MLRTTQMAVLCALIAGSSAAAAHAGEMTLTSALYPEDRRIELTFQATARAPEAALEGDVEPSHGQSWIELRWKRLEPAVLFGGDINCWVVWAVTPDGVASALGELPVGKDRSGSARFSTLQKSFALMVTAEPFPVVKIPSEVVGFTSHPSSSKFTRSQVFSFTGFRPASIQRDRESIAGMRYEDETPIALHQARRAIEIMDRFDAGKYAETQARVARTALTQADDAYAGRMGKRADVAELSRRATSLAAQAIREAMKKSGDLKPKDGGAQTDSEKQAMARTEDALSDARRLSVALSAVARTEATARGLVVSLPGDILFDANKSELKPDAKIMLARLAGILLMIPDTRIGIEGHTDATGSEESNVRLSLERAASVVAFLKSQGVAEASMRAKGLGSSRPVADNDTADDRARIQRVEIVVPSEQ